MPTGLRCWWTRRQGRGRLGLVRQDTWACRTDRRHREAGSPPHVLTDPIWSYSQEPDYGALYEGRNPGFYVEANPMPTFKV